MENFISVDEFCNSHNIEISFITSLQEFGLVEIMTIEHSTFIPVDELQKLERLIRLHFELDINFEGIETITHMLARIDQMQEEITVLKNHLRLYENI